MYAMFMYDVKKLTAKELFDDGQLKTDIESVLKETQIRLENAPDKGWIIQSHSIFILEDRLVMTFLCSRPLTNADWVLPK